MEDAVVFSKEDIELLEELWKLPFLEGLKRIGCKGQEIKTPHGEIRIIESPFMKEIKVKA